MIMTTSALVITVLVCMAISVVAMVVWLTGRTKYTLVNKRLANISHGGFSQHDNASIRKVNLARRSRLHALWIQLDVLLTKADKNAVALMTLGFPIGSYLLFPKLPIHLQIGSAVVAWVVCIFVLAAYRKRLQTEEFEKGIINVLGLISRAVSAGLSVSQAIEQVAKTQPGLLGREFANIRDTLALGGSLRHALDDATIRLPYNSFHYFSVALILNQSNGGQLREILHNLSRTMHDNRAMKKKVKSLTSEPRMTGLFLSALPLALLGAMAWMEPAMIERLFETESGQNVMIYVVGSISLGAICLNAMTRNKRFAS